LTQTVLDADKRTKMAEGLAYLRQFRGTIPVAEEYKREDEIWEENRIHLFIDRIEFSESGIEVVFWGTVNDYYNDNDEQAFIEEHMSIYWQGAYGDTVESWGGGETDYRNSYAQVFWRGSSPRVVVTNASSVNGVDIYRYEGSIVFPNSILPDNIEQLDTYSIYYLWFFDFSVPILDIAEFGYEGIPPESVDTIVSAASVSIKTALIDIGVYCDYKYGDNAIGIMGDRWDAYSWNCYRDNQLLGGIDMSEACRVQHPDLPNAALSSRWDAYNWYCTKAPSSTASVLIDIGVYCDYKYGDNAIGIMGDRRDAYSWNCYRDNQLLGGIDMGEACRVQHLDLPNAVMGDRWDAYSWYCINQ
jgi:hypothetical protein